MTKLEWIKELVLAEQKMEESGVVDFTAGYDPAQSLQLETVEFLKELKVSFIESASAFNQLKGSHLGNIKIYGISKTDADFMLFRNGFKLIFSKKQAGSISIRFQFMAHPLLASTNMEAAAPDEDLLIAQAGPYGDLTWTFQGAPVKLDYLVRYYMSRFVRESAK